MAFGFGFALTAIAKAVGFSPLNLFTSGAQGAWYDPSDYSTMFEDSAGTIPITSPLEKPVGLMLDKSKGLVLGSELVTNGDFSNGTTGWVATTQPAATLANVAGELQTTTNSGGGAKQELILTVGKWYKATAQLRIATGSTSCRLAVLNNAESALLASSVDVSATTTTSVSLVFLATETNSKIYVRNYPGGAQVSLADNISVRELPGNHAYQSTTTSRPTLSARYNLLTKTEQFDDAAWTKASCTVTAAAVTAPNGTLTGTKINEDTSNARHQVYQQYQAGTATTIYTFLCYIQPAERTKAEIRISSNSPPYNALLGVVDLTLGTISVTSSGATLISSSVTKVANGWYACSMSGYTNQASAHLVSVCPCDASGAATYSGTTNYGVYIWGADLRVANDGIGLPAYQRVNTATDYDYAGFPPYLKFDGTDDSMVTNSIDFTGTDKMSVFAGVRKLSDAAIGTIVELSVSYGTNAGAFLLSAPDSISASTYGVGLHTSTTGYYLPSVFASPVTNTIAIKFDAAASGLANQIIPRINGSINQSNGGGSVSSGNFGNYPLYIGRRGGSSLPFNGRIYSLIVCGKLASAAEIASTENWVEAKTFGKDMNYVYSDEVLTAASEQITTADGQNVYMTVTYQ